MSKQAISPNLNLIRRYSSLSVLGEGDARNGSHCTAQSLSQLVDALSLLLAPTNFRALALHSTHAPFHFHRR
jgi:hypothetical protein